MAHSISVLIRTTCSRLCSAYFTSGTIVFLGYQTFFDRLDIQPQNTCLDQAARHVYFIFSQIDACWIMCWMCIHIREVYLSSQGMIAGHAYYFLEDVYPRMTGRRPLRTPAFIRSLFADEPVVAARPAAVRFAAPPVDDAPPRWNSLIHFSSPVNSVNDNGCFIDSSQLAKLALTV